MKNSFYVEPEVKINELAERAKTDNRAFEDLYLLVKPTFPRIVRNYSYKKNLTGFTFDTDDYTSIVGQAFWETIEKYDRTKGDFMSRFIFFAENRMKQVTDYNLSGKRFDKSMRSLSLQEGFFDNHKALVVEDNVFNNTQKYIENFINTDKEGKIISILMYTKDQKIRREAFIEYFGKYTTTERKRVQRVRQRLKVHLTHHGVFI